MKPSKLCWLLLLLLPISQLKAEMVETNVTHPLPLSAIKPTLSLVGDATFSVLFWDIYHSELYTSTGDYPVHSDQFVLFEITYLKEISKQSLITRTREQWQHLGVSDTVYRPYLLQLDECWRDIQPGDQLSLLVKNKRSYFYFNQQLTGVIEQPEFANLFLAIWLSEKTSQPTLRMKLLRKSL